VLDWPTAWQSSLFPQFMGPSFICHSDGCEDRYSRLVGHHAYLYLRRSPSGRHCKLKRRTWQGLRFPWTNATFGVCWTWSNTRCECSLNLLSAGRGGRCTMAVSGWRSLFRPWPRHGKPVAPSAKKKPGARSGWESADADRLREVKPGAQNAHWRMYLKCQTPNKCGTHWCLWLVSESWPPDQEVGDHFKYEPNTRW